MAIVINFDFPKVSLLRFIIIYPYFGSVPHFGLDPDPRIHPSDQRTDPDADLDPDIFVIDLQNAKKKNFLLITFEGTFTSFFKEKKVQKKSQNNNNQGFSYFFCLMIEGSESRSIYMTNGSG